MSASELMALLERAQRQDLGEEPIEVTLDQVERLEALLEGQQISARTASAIPQDGRLVLVRG